MNYTRYTGSGEKDTLLSQPGSSSNNYLPHPLNLSTTYNDVDDYDNEPPLLEELGIRFDHIWSKTQAVINPLQV